MSEPASAAAPDGVTVTGSARVPVAADLLVVRCGAEATGQSVRTALERCSVAMNAMLEVIRQAGVAERDRHTDHASVQQSYDHHGHPQGWSAVQTLTVRLRDLARAGEIINAALAAGGDAARLFSVRFDVDDAASSWAAANAQARRRAFEDARGKAEQYAALAGRRLGEVVAIRERDLANTIPPVLAAAPAMASTIPLEQGELSAHCLIEVRWKLTG